MNDMSEGKIMRLLLSLQFTFGKCGVSGANWAYAVLVERAGRIGHSANVLVEVQLVICLGGVHFVQVFAIVCAVKEAQCKICAGLERTAGPDLVHKN
jgi:hypothetical protein